MQKVKVTSTFKDKKEGMKTRLQGDEFEVSNERAKELEKRGLVSIIETPKEKKEVEVKNEKKEIKKP